MSVQARGGRFLLNAPLGTFLWGAIATYAVKVLFHGHRHARANPRHAATDLQLPRLRLWLDKRFSWQGNAPAARERADYEVMGTDWLTLVEKFGLAQYLHIRG